MKLRKHEQIIDDLIEKGYDYYDALDNEDKLSIIFAKYEDETLEEIIGEDYSGSLRCLFTLTDEDDITYLKDMLVKLILKADDRLCIHGDTIAEEYANIVRAKRDNEYSYDDNYYLDDYTYRYNDYMRY